MSASALTGLRALCPPVLGSDGQAFAVTFGVSLMSLCAVLLGRHLGLFSALVGRKLMHICTGPVFVYTWLLFPDPPAIGLARVLASLVPGLITLYFVAVGTRLMPGKQLVSTVSRRGTPSELLKGPLAYGIVHTVVTLLTWRTHRSGALALLILCVGDGVADLVGRRFGTVRLPWNRDKSLQGSVALIVSSWIVTVAYDALFAQCGMWPPTPDRLWTTAALSVFAGAVESLPIREWDNVTVPLACLLAGYALF